MTRTISRAALALSLFLTAGLAACDQQPTAPANGAVTAARQSRGKDDPAGHDKNDDRDARRRREAEPGDDRRGRGADDGANHK